MRGKYGKRAAVRREAAEVEATEEVYKRNIVRLTKERDQARAERDEAILHWKKEVRILRAQLAEGTSPRVEALVRETNSLRTNLDEAKRVNRAARENWERTFTRMHDHMVTEHGMSGKEAFGFLFSLAMGSKSMVTVGIEKQVGQLYGSGVVAMLREARGE